MFKVFWSNFKLLTSFYRNRVVLRKRVVMSCLCVEFLFSCVWAFCLHMCLCTTCVVAEVTLSRVSETVLGCSLCSELVTVNVLLSPIPTVLLCLCGFTQMGSSFDRPTRWSCTHSLLRTLGSVLKIVGTNPSIGLSLWFFFSLNIGFLYFSRSSRVRF